MKSILASILLMVLYTLVIALFINQNGLLSSVPRMKQTQQKPLKIYMYPLSSYYNMDLVKKYGETHQNIQNETGWGIPLANYEFVYDTNQYALEQYFYYRLTHSDYLTNNAEEADLFYIPLFPNLAKMVPHYQVIYDFWKWSSKQLLKNGTLSYKNTHKHFVVYGGCMLFAHAFRQNPLVNNMTIVTVERIAPRFQKSNAIVAPYPSEIHFYPNRTDSIDFSKKDLLVSSVWNSRYRMRSLLAGLCVRKYDDICKHLELRPNNDSYNHSVIYQHTSRSVFCINPPGDSPTRKAFWDALLVGCINVIYDNYTVKYPFDDIFKYNNMTLYIPPTQAEFTFEILKNVSKEVIRQKQQYIDQHRLQFQYTIVETDSAAAIPNRQKDAFKILLDEIYWRSINKE